jgi:hypothetical protein
MSVLLVTYDLKVKGQNYEGILGIVKKYSYTKLSESSYAIDTTESPDTIYEKLKPSLDENDNLYVITLSNPRMGRHIGSVRAWLKEHLH